MKFRNTLISAATLLCIGQAALAAVSAEEAKQLGTTLTAFGAEKAGNKDGSIPEYTGGLPTSTSPAGFSKGSGKWVNPYAAEKPLYAITGKNVDQYADKLTDASKALLKRYPSYRMDVYPSHRSVNYPKYYVDATLRNATVVPSMKDGESSLRAAGGVPYPIPKTGTEVVWNQVVRYLGPAAETAVSGYYVDASGKPILGAEIKVQAQWLYNQQGMTLEQLQKEGGYYWQTAYVFNSPARTRGDGNVFQDNITPERKAHSYSASTRRVRLAPDIAYDTPITSTGGVVTYDETSLFFGKMDRFDFKLVGKKELYIPYHQYDLLFKATPEQLLTPNHLNPDFQRWELHRVWVVEATLKPSQRHIYSKFTLYLDEDWSGAGARDDYDSGGKLFKGIYSPGAWLYDVQVPYSFTFYGYDLTTGTYAISNSPFERGYFKPRDTAWPPATFTPDAMSARSKQ